VGIFAGMDIVTVPKTVSLIRDIDRHILLQMDTRWPHQACEIYLVDQRVSICNIYKTLPHGNNIAKSFLKKFS
jgi:hypothetical protein